MCFKQSLKSQKTETKVADQINDQQTTQEQMVFSDSSIFLFLFCFLCGNEILLSSQNRKMTKWRKFSAKSYRTGAEISSPMAERQRGGEGEGALSDLSPRCKANPAKTQEYALFFLTNSRQTFLKYSFFYPQERMTFICLFYECYLKIEGYLTIFVPFQRLCDNTI